MEAWTTLKEYDNYITAHILKARLEEEGIPCFLKDEHTVVMQWHLSRALGGIKLQVRGEDLDRAKAYVKEWEAEALAEQETPGFWETDTEQLDPNNRICIHCGSKNTRSIDFDKKPAFISWLLLGFPIGVKSNKWHCFHCGKEF